MEEAQLEEIYKPEVKQVEDFCGLSMNHARAGEAVHILSKAFLTSFDHVQMSLMVELTRLFVHNPAEINSLLVVIRNNEARIYRKFPLSVSIKAKRNLPSGGAVFLKDIADIEGIQFQDAIFCLDVIDGDKFLWLFRKRYSFGLYFDFSGKLVANQLPRELGKHYKELEYYSIYSFFKQSINCDLLLRRGWFPFIQLIGNGIERLTNVNNEADLDTISDSLVKEFTRERIDNFVQCWWTNSVFEEKKIIIEAGLHAYHQEQQASTINCIKNLILEIEGIIRLSFHRDKGTKPTTKELKDYLNSKAKFSFSTENSLGFPGLFAEYLNKVIFNNFDIESGNVSFSRHAIGHGVAPDTLFSRERALQCILILDQLYFYLGHNPNN